MNAKDRKGRVQSPRRDGRTTDDVKPIPFERHLEVLGLNADEWRQLKNLVIENAHGHMLPIPETVAGHKIAVLVAEHRRTGRKDLLKEAAVLLVGSSDSVWLALDRS